MTKTMMIKKKKIIKIKPNLIDNRLVMNLKQSINKEIKSQNFLTAAIVDMRELKRRIKLKIEK